VLQQNLYPVDRVYIVCYDTERFKKIIVFSEIRKKAIFGPGANLSSEKLQNVKRKPPTRGLSLLDYASTKATTIRIIAPSLTLTAAGARQARSGNEQKFID